MSLFWTLQAALIIGLCASAVDVTKKHVSCSDAQTQEGFQFKYGPLAAVEISVYHNKTLIGLWEKGKQAANSSDIIRMVNNSVITKECRDYCIQVFTVNQNKQWEEHNFNFITTGNSYNPVTPGSQVNNTQFIQENTTEPVLPTTGSQTWIGYPFVVALIIGLLLYCYVSWKKKSLLWLCNALKKRFSTEAESSEPGETSLEVVVATHPFGSGENGGAQNSPRGYVHDASLDHKLGNGEFQPTANGHPNNPDVDGASHHGDMNSVRSRRDDPGGSSGDVREDFPGSDTRAEAEPLVDKGGQDQDHVRRCFATPGHDVESMTRVKN